MQYSATSLFLASALVIAACSAAPKTEPVPPPAAKPVQVVAAPTNPPAAPSKKPLKTAMKSIEEDFKLIEKAIETGSLGDSKALAAAAEKCAAVMKLGYDKYEDKEVPDFAKFARESEAALKVFAQEAAQGHADTVKQLGKTLQAQHCARCHDAVEKVHG
jgi:hypothetical protein